MTARAPLVLNNGQIQQLQAGDTLAGATGVTMQQVTLDFGSEPVPAKTFVFTATATPGQTVIMTPAGDMPSGVDLDEFEMDGLMCAAKVSASNQITAVVTASPGPVSGQRTFNLLVI